MTEISVSRILGESFDLVSGATLPKAVVLTNGTEEVSVYVDDATAMAILALVQEPEQEQPEEKPKKRSKKKSKKEEPSPSLMVVDELEAYRDASTGAPSL